MVGCLCPYTSGPVSRVDSFTTISLLQVPLLCFQSAVVNSLRGAAFLSGLQNALILDIGGTTSDIAILVNGMPRQSASTALLAGKVRSNFPLPDVLRIGAISLMTSHGSLPLHGRITMQGACRVGRWEFGTPTARRYKCGA